MRLTWTIAAGAWAGEGTMKTGGNDRTIPAVATLGAGCFWCTEAVFQQLPGVLHVTSGYQGGHVANPTYRQVCAGDTGHAEVVRIDYDPAIISYEQLLDVFFRMHDPTTLNRQGADVGTSYRSIIFTHTPEQKLQAQAFLANLERQHTFDRPIVTEIVEGGEFYPAEADHQDYYERNQQAPYCRLVIAPKLRKLKLSE